MHENVRNICSENECNICSDNVCIICSENVRTICSENGCDIYSENGGNICSEDVCTLCSENVCSADYCKFLSTCSLLLLVNCLLPQLNVCLAKSKVGILGKGFKEITVQLPARKKYNSIKSPNSHPDCDSVNMTVNFRAPLYS